MAIRCTYCLLPGGPGIGRALGTIFEDEKEFLEHLETVHDLPMRRVGETAVEALERVKAKNPRVGGPHCQCPACLHRRGELP